MICNATPLICLAKIKQLELLKKLFHTITIPQSVAKEVLIEGKPGYAFIKEAIQEGWIKVCNPKNNINLELGKGENAAVNLANERKDTLIIDDAFAIKVAKSLNIDFIRTTTIIFMALKKKIINKKQAISFINKLIEEGYYISSSLYPKIMEIINSI